MNLAAVILAAGKGTRMNEGSASPIPKVMFEANGKPLLFYSVKNVQDAGIKRVIAVVGYKQEMIREYFGGTIEYAVQEQQLGTGHAAMMARESLIGQVEAVVVCYGDMPLFKPETIKNLLITYQQEKPTIAMLSVDFADPNFWAFGRILRDENGYVSEIVEQKDCTDEQKQISESNPGFYIFDAEWLWQNFEKLSTNNAQKEYYLTDLIKIAKDQGKKIIAVKVSSEEEVLGVNNPDQLKEAENILASRG
jgi:bifunctional UDP-N-acetylglucosamine pyrophosphorylase/glucosamine-1-phosphate N-acetyltransferase